MSQTFYNYVVRYANPDGKDPTSRLANHIIADHGFPKQSNNFHDISDYLEGNPDYGKLLTVFDDLWQEYSYRN